MKFELDPLPYAKSALAPHLTEETLSFHYDKHHSAYMNNLKKLLEGKPEAEKSLEEIVKTSSGGIFNNAAQVWNHTFFWRGMKPGGGGAPTGELAKRIDVAFGSYAKFVEEMKAACTGRFGSGWAWLVADGGTLKIVSTPNAETPLTTAAQPLLTVDVWEHAYYLDYQNQRAAYVQAFFDKLVNWEFVAANLAKAR